jgi:hypothetical protein
MDAGSKAAGATSDAVQTATGAVANVVTEAARQFLPTTLVGHDEDEDKGRGSLKGRKVQYAHLSSDHNKRKTTRKTKDEKAEKH